jgi:hypothetical protein
MKKVIAVLMFGLLCAMPAMAQTCTVGYSCKGTITSANAACNATNCVNLKLPVNSGAAAITISGTYSATNQFEASGDNTNWSAVSCFPSNNPVGVSTATGVGLWQCPVSGFTGLRVRASAYVSGTATIAIQATQASGTPTNSGVIGNSTTGLQANAALAAGADGFNNAAIAHDQCVTTDCVKLDAPLGFNGSTWDRQRTASLANDPTSQTTTARNSIGAQIVESGSRWSVVSAPAVSNQATASIAAEASVRHVATGVCFSAAATTAPVLTQLTINLRDGATGAGTVIAYWTVAVPAATGQSVAPICFPIGPLPGTTNTAMTLEFSALLTNLFESVTLNGYNVN